MLPTIDDGGIRPAAEGIRTERRYPVERNDPPLPPHQCVRARQSAVEAGLGLPVSLPHHAHA